MLLNNPVAVATGLLSFCLPTLAADAGAWRGRSIYQVMVDRFARDDQSTTATCDTSVGAYCGGTWNGLIQKLDYIQGMGFDAIWISPIVKNLEGSTPDGSSYHGYWQQDLNALNQHFGSADDLKNLADQLHGRGMYLMVDVITNHMATGGDKPKLSDQVPFSDDKYYHSYCNIDYNNIANLTQLEQCRGGDQSVSLADLRTEDNDVRDMFGTWISNLVHDYSIDGLRIDSFIEVEPAFWQGFLNSAGVYAVGEAYNGDVGFVCGYQNSAPGVMNYPMYFPLIKAFTSSSGSISELVNTLDSVKSTCKDTSLLGSFSENHDQPRFGQLTSDIAEAKNVIAFTILADGIPIIYQGQEQHYQSVGGSGVPYNREAVWFSAYNTDAELYKLIKTLNAARHNAISNDEGYLFYQNWHIYTDNNNIAMRKGQMVTVLSNNGASGSSYTLNIPSGYPSGTQVTELLSCQTLTAGNNGNLAVPMSQGLPRVYYPTANISQSGLCASSTKQGAEIKRVASRGGSRAALLPFRFPASAKFKPRQASKFWASADYKA